MEEYNKWKQNWNEPFIKKSFPGNSLPWKDIPFVFIWYVIDEGGTNERVLYEIPQDKEVEMSKLIKKHYSKISGEHDKLKEWKSNYQKPFIKSVSQGNFPFYGLDYVYIIKELESIPPITHYIYPKSHQDKLHEVIKRIYE
jgi:hypothetical protein